MKKAGEGARTLDINVGNVTLYQLSYARTDRDVSWLGDAVKRCASEGTRERRMLCEAASRALA
jgi:hypothetical protein